MNTISLFGKDSSFIKVGKYNFIDVSLVISVSLDLYFRGKTADSNLYRISFMLDMSPQYPISKTVFLTYRELNEFLYYNPEFCGKLSQKKYIKSLDADPSDLLEHYRINYMNGVLGKELEEKEAKEKPKRRRKKKDTRKGEESEEI